MKDGSVEARSCSRPLVAKIKNGQIKQKVRVKQINVPERWSLTIWVALFQMT